MKKIILGIVLFMTGNGILLAQQDPIYSQYMFNGITLNPAYSGTKGVLNFNAIYRRQWIGIQGAPTTLTFSGDAPISKQKIGIGGFIQNDKLGAESRLSMYGTFAYKMPVSFSSSLSFGLAFGAFQYTLDGSKLVFNEKDGDQTAAANSGISNAWKPDMRFGVYYNNDDFYAGFSVSNLFQNTLTLTVGSATRDLTFVRHYYFTTGYIFHVTDGLQIYPSILVKEDFKSPTDIDINAFALINKTIWLGTSYRTAMLMGKDKYGSVENYKNALLFIVQVYLNERIRVGYAYDIALNDLRAYTSGSHEISMAYLLPVSRRSRMLSPRYF